MLTHQRNIDVCRFTEGDLVAGKDPFAGSSPTNNVQKGGTYVNVHVHYDNVQGGGGGRLAKRANRLAKRAGRSEASPFGMQFT